jgi:hypothetical protein
VIGRCEHGGGHERLGQKEIEFRSPHMQEFAFVAFTHPRRRAKRIWRTSKCLTNKERTLWTLADCFKPLVDLGDTPAFPESPGLASM